MTLGEKLAQLRRRNNYTQEELADILDVSRQSVSKWESDTAYPEMDRLIKIGELYGCSMDYLLKDGGDGDDNDGAENSVQSAENIATNKKRRNRNIVSAIVGSTVIAVTALYLTLGFVWDLWHPGWIVFFLIPVSSSLAAAAVKRKASEFAYPVPVAALYLLMGFVWDLWHPGWIIFLTIPLYYIIVGIFDKKQAE